MRVKRAFMEIGTRTRADGLIECRVQIQGKRFSAYGRTKDVALAKLNDKLLEWERSLNRADATTLASFWETAYLPSVATKGDKWKGQIAWVKTHCKTILYRPLDEITRHDIQMIVNQSTLSRNSLMHIKTVLFGVFKLAVIDEHIQSNPAEYIKLPRSVPTPNPIISAQELHQMILRSKCQRVRASIVLGGLLGLRIGEIQALREEHFGDGTELIVPGTKTDAAYRVLPMPKKALGLIAGMPFPLSYASSSHECKQMKKLGPSHVSPQVLRRSCNTGLQELGCPMEVRMKILGHTPQGVQAHYSFSQMQTQMSEWLERWTSAVLSTDAMGTQWGSGGAC